MHVLRNVDDVLIVALAAMPSLPRMLLRNPDAFVCYTVGVNGLLRRCAALTVLSALAACGGGGTAGAPSLSTICLYSGLSQMIYPLPGATSVPDSPAQVVFATSQLLPASFQLRLASTNSANAALAGQAAAFTRITAAQVPQPSATLQISNPYYESASLATPFSSGTQYVFFNDSLYSCTPTLQGSFTAQ